VLICSYANIVFNLSYCLLFLMFPFPDMSMNFFFVCLFVLLIGWFSFTFIFALQAKFLQSLPVKQVVLFSLLPDVRRDIL